MQRLEVRIIGMMTDCGGQVLQSIQGQAKPFKASLRGCVFHFSLVLATLVDELRLQPANARVVGRRLLTSFVTLGSHNTSIEPA